MSFLRVDENHSNLLNRISIGLSCFLCSMFWVDAEEARVFPGAQGYGVESPAGRGGQIIRVDNLNSSGPGSLRDAIDTAGPRIIVFEAGGIIDLEERAISINEPFLTIAGQTAPSPGITIIRGGFHVDTHDVLMRHIRVRPGDGGHGKRSGWAPDGLTTSGGDAYNIVVDHCSFSWAVDENLSASGPRTNGPEATSRRITFSNCIIAEGLDDSSHPKGKHSKGTLIHDYCTEIAIIGNLFAHNVRRNPYFKAFTTGVIVNNLIYNPGNAAIQLDYVTQEWQGTGVEPNNAQVAVVGNVMIHGEDSAKRLPLVTRRGDAFLEDNIALNRDDGPVDIAGNGISRLENKPVWPQGFEALPAENLVDHVITHAGARPNDRDEVDLRIVREFLAREGRIIDSQEDVGGYPEAPPTYRKLDIPEDDVDDWLAEFALRVE